MIPKAELVRHCQFFSFRNRDGRSPFVGLWVKEMERTNILDAPYFDPIKQLNTVFPHPSAVTSISQVSGALHACEHELDHQIEASGAQQSTSDSHSMQRMLSIQHDLADLFSKIEGVRERALLTEQTISEMTADIKRLDKTKRNLTLSMTTLKRMQMLTTAYEQLRTLSSSRQYKECAQILQAVIQLMAHFKSYRSIDQIATLSKNVSDAQREVLEQICEDFEAAFAKAEVTQRRTMLAEACLVMDALGDNARSRLMIWYCNTQLREYRQVFRGNDEAGSLDNLSRRYAYFRRVLKTYDDQHAAIFPPSWLVDEALANAFCETTRDDFKSILGNSIAKGMNGSTLDVNLLLSCLQETLQFEQGLEKKFSRVPRASIDTVVSSEERTPFTHAISDAFEPYLSVWVEAQDRQLSNLILSYRQKPLKASDEEFSSQTVTPSSVELFSFYRSTLAQCAKLSTGIRLVELSKVFAKHLDQYAQQVLLLHISERPTGQTPSQTPTVEEAMLVLNTADYCYNTCTQLEERIKSRVDRNLKEEINMQSQADAFMGVASACIQNLVRRVEVDLEPTWREMRNFGLGKVRTVSDQSSYVATMQNQIQSRASEILGLLQKQQYMRAFCDNLVELISSSYLASIISCRPISEAGAEQLLLDSYALTQTFNALIPNAPPNYLKQVSRNTTTRLSPLLKTLQVSPSPPEALVQAYLIHIGDKSDVNFRKILDLKGITKKDQGSLVELFNAHKESSRHKNLPASSPFLTSIIISSGGVGVSSLSNATSGLSAATLQRGFDPATLGALMTAARDGVDRLGSPAIGSTAGSRAVSPPPSGGIRSESPNPGAGVNLNQNLRNLGAFFKRDLGSFGGRFGKANVDDGAK